LAQSKQPLAQQNQTTAQLKQTQSKKEYRNAKLKIEMIKVKNKLGHHITAVWRNWGFRQTLKLVLYLEVRSLIYTFG
jgi:hypothetical protein